MEYFLNMAMDDKGESSKKKKLSSNIKLMSICINLNLIICAVCSKNMEADIMKYSHFTYPDP